MTQTAWHPGPGGQGAPPRLTPSAQRTLDELLMVSATRPYAPPGLVDELAATLASGTAAALSRWGATRLWVTKSELESVLRCESAYVDRRAQTGPRTTTLAAVVGDVSHRAIQMASTHPGRPVLDYVQGAIDALQESDEVTALFLSALPLAGQSDLVTTSVSRVASYLDSWPPLHPSWTPRFEESVQVRVGPHLTLAGRADLVLGRPKGNGLQTMVVVDFKTGALKDSHQDEAMYYALLFSLRHGIPPFRSLIYSFASGTWTAPDVTAPLLRAAATRVVVGVNALVDVLTDTRAATEGPGDWC